MSKVIFWTGLNNVLKTKAKISLDLNGSRANEKNSSSYFTEDGTHKALTYDWIYNRYVIWKHLTYQSILQQDTPYDLYVLVCHIKSKAIIEEIFKEELANDPKLKILYNHCDSFEGECLILTEKATKEDPVYLVRIDSDDCYHPNVCKKLLSLDVSKTPKFISFNHGYNYDYKNNVMEIRNYKKEPYTPPLYASKNTEPVSTLDQGGNHVKIQKKKPMYLNDIPYFLFNITGMNVTWSIGRRRNRTKAGDKLIKNTKEYSKILKSFGMQDHYDALKKETFKT